MARFLGITVLGDFILSEGVEAILDNLQRIGATAVACNPTVSAPAAKGEGSFQPPVDAGSSPRLFDRPLFGKRALWLKSGVSYAPRVELYQSSPYAPRRPNDLTESHGAIIGQFIRLAAARGLKVYLQIGAAQPSGLRDEDRPRLPNGDIPPNRLADTASLASEAVRAYNRAYIRDLLAEYPQISGFRPDWPEYPCYTLGEVFQDFGLHVETWARRKGIDFPALRSELNNVWNFLHGGLTNEHLLTLLPTLSWDNAGLLEGFPAVRDWLQLKQELSRDILQHWRDAIDDAGGRQIELSANAFMFPYSRLTGLDFAGASSFCHSVAPKLYTMHWSQMVTFWGTELLQSNPGLSEPLVVRAIEKLMDLTDDDLPRTLDDYGYPEPDEPHPIANGPQQRKIERVRDMVDGRCGLSPLVHGYGPPDDFRRRLQLVRETSADGVWINRYGYLSEEKLRAIADVWQDAPRGNN